MKRVNILLAAGLLLLAAVSLPTIRAGAQQTIVTYDNLDQMIANAKTPADHEAIAAYYQEQAADAKKKADLHRRTAETYRSLKISKPVYMAEMCDGIVSGRSWGMTFETFTTRVSLASNFQTFPFNGIVIVPVPPFQQCYANVDSGGSTAR